MLKLLHTFPRVINDGRRILILFLSSIVLRTLLQFPANFIDITSSFFRTCMYIDFARVFLSWDLRFRGVKLWLVAGNVAPGKMI